VSFVTLPDLTINQTMYDERAPFYLSASFSIGYLCSFMNIAAVISHVYLWHGSQIWKQTKEAFGQLKTDLEDDIHNRLMRSYYEVPDSAYLIWFFIFLVIQILVCAFTPFKMPVWATIFAVFLGGILALPIGIIQAVSGSQMGLNVLTEFIIGFLLPGNTVAVMTFKSLGYNVMIQALSMTRDLKIAHYMHISPVAMVFCQLLGCIVGGILNTTTVFWIMDVMGDQLNEIGGEWSATGYRTFVAAGSIWGTIGPARFFGSQSPYYTLLWGFLIGLLLPFIPYLLYRIWPTKILQRIHIPLLTQGTAPGMNQALVVIPFLLSYIFNHVIYNNKRDWWNKYNFILACALNSGVAIATLLIVFWKQVGSSGPLEPSPLRPSTNLDYYCREKSWN
jgi:OPT family oligopeptide transporter